MRCPIAEKKSVQNIDAVSDTRLRIKGNFFIVHLEPLNPFLH